MKHTIFKGAGVAIVTPMHADGSVNWDKLGELIDWQIEEGTDAIIICGTTGESSTLDDDEHIEAIRFAVQHTNKRIPVVAGAGSNDTAYAIKLAKEGQSLGADALLVVTPYYNKASQKGLIAHYTQIAKNTDLPIIVYNVPSRTGVNILPATYNEMSKVENIVGIKEANSNIVSVAQTMALCGDRIDLYSGNDDQIVPLLSLGGSGVISVLANIMPRQTHEICQLYFDGKVKESAELQLKLMDLATGLFMDVNPIPIKEALNMMGKEAGVCRMPLIEMDEDKKEALKVILQKHNLI